MKSIWNPLSWGRTLVAIAAAGMLAACAKNESKHDHQPGEAHAGGAASENPAKPHGGHDAAHGGLVLMDATYHVEIVLDTAAGKHRVHVSDGARSPLPASTFDAVELTVAGEKLAMTRAADDKSWEASGKPAPTAGAKVSIAYSKGGQLVARFDDLAIEYVLTGKIPTTGPTPPAVAPQTAGGHEHRSPHGGMVASTSGGHLELVADRAGVFQVWLLDAKLAPRPIAGASVKLEVTAKGYGEVVVEAKGDHFEGKGAAIPGGHAAAVVTATVGGTAETARFPLHLDSHAPAGGHGH